MTAGQPGPPPTPSTTQATTPSTTHTTTHTTTPPTLTPTPAPEDTVVPGPGEALPQVLSDFRAIRQVMLRAPVGRVAEAGAPYIRALGLSDDRLTAVCAHALHAPADMIGYLAPVLRALDPADAHPVVDHVLHRVASWQGPERALSRIVEALLHCPRLTDRTVEALAKVVPAAGVPAIARDPRLTTQAAHHLLAGPPAEARAAAEALLSEPLTWSDPALLLACARVLPAATIPSALHDRLRRSATQQARPADLPRYVLGAVLAHGPRRGLDALRELPVARLSEVPPEAWADLLASPEVSRPAYASVREAVAELLGRLRPSSRPAR